MANYLDVYILPIKEENVSRYKAIASAAGKVFRKNGALSYREYVASDLKAEGTVPFQNMAGCGEGETVIYAAVEFESEQHRNESMKAIMADPEMASSMPEECENVFDWKRMSYGGFSLLVEE